MGTHFNRLNLEVDDGGQAYRLMYSWLYHMTAIQKSIRDAVAGEPASGFMGWEPEFEIWPGYNFSVTPRDDLKLSRLLIRGEKENRLSQPYTAAHAFASGVAIRAKFEANDLDGKADVDLGFRCLASAGQDALEKEVRAVEVPSELLHKVEFKVVEAVQA